MIVTALSIIFTTAVILGAAGTSVLFMNPTCWAVLASVSFLVMSAIAYRSLSNTYFSPGTIITHSDGTRTIYANLNGTYPITPKPGDITVDPNSTKHIDETSA